MASKKSAKNTTKNGIFKPLATAFLASDSEDDDIEIHTPTVQHTRPAYRPVEPIRSLTELTKEETRVMLKEQLVSRAASDIKKTEKAAKKESSASEDTAEQTKSSPETGKKKAAKKEAEDTKHTAKSSEKPEKTKAAAKTEAPKAVAKASVKPVAGKSAGKAEAAGKASAKAAPKTEKKETPQTAKTELQASSARAEMHIEYQGRSYDREELIERAVTIWVKKLRRGRNNLSSLELYVKPQEQMVYYVFNKTRSGSFPL